MNSKIKRLLFPKRQSWVINKLIQDTLIPLKIFKQATAVYLKTLKEK